MMLLFWNTPDNLVQRHIFVAKPSHTIRKGNNCDSKLFTLYKNNSMHVWFVTFFNKFEKY